MKFIRSALCLIKNQSGVIRAPIQTRYLSVTPRRFSEKKNVTYCGEIGKPSVATGYHEIKACQELYQVDDGLPVFLKGKYDKYLYKGTFILALIGLILSLKFISSMMF